MSKGYLFLIYAITIMFIYLSLRGGAMIVQGGKFIDYKKAVPSKQAFMKKNERKFDLAVKGICVVGMGFAWVVYVIPAIRDIPTVLTGNYETVEGVAVTHAGISNTRLPKVVTIKESNGIKIRLRFYSDEVNVGDHLKVIYLPHLKQGTILEHRPR